MTLDVRDKCERYNSLLSENALLLFVFMNVHFANHVRKKYAPTVVANLLEDQENN